MATFKGPDSGNFVFDNGWIIHQQEKKILFSKCLNIWLTPMKPFNKSPYIKNKNNSSYIKIPVTGAHQTVPGTGYAATAVTAARYKADHSKREQFWRYLKKSRVLDTLTKKVLVALYEEPGKPNSAF